MSFTVYPAIDVRAQAVVRLAQGDYERQTTYADSPLALAQRYAESGAHWLHLIDLDAAREGGYTLAPLLRQITQGTGLKVQTGGGIRSEDDVQRLLDHGAARVVVGSLAVRDPALVSVWLQRFGAEQLVIALDTRFADGQWQLPLHGWTQGSGRSLDELAAVYRKAGARHLLCTDISRDGMMAGPNLSLYQHLRKIFPAAQIQASGGIRDLADIHAARGVGCAGAVLGKALLEGRFDLPQALAC